MTNTDGTEQSLALAESAVAARVQAVVLERYQVCDFQDLPEPPHFHGTLYIPATDAGQQVVDAG